MTLGGIFHFMSLPSSIMSYVCTRSFCNGKDINSENIKRIIFKKKCKIKSNNALEAYHGIGGYCNTVG